LHKKEYQGKSLKAPVELPDVPSNIPVGQTNQKDDNNRKGLKEPSQTYPPFKIKEPVEVDLKTEKTVDEHLHAMCKAHFDKEYKNRIIGNNKTEYEYISHDNEYCYGTVTNYIREDENKPFVETGIENIKCNIEPKYEKGTNKSKYIIDECEFE
jgi:hypothetical protein